MKFAPHILGAVAVVGVAGALSGATIGDSPVLKKAHSDTMPEAPIVRAGDNARLAAQNPPDHYPLKTAKGTVPVEELALRGRMRDRGGDLWWEGRDSDTRQLDAGYDFYETASPERIEHERRLLAFHAGRAPATSAQAEQPAKPARLSRAEAPLALADPVELEIASPAPPTAAAANRTGNSKTVDVVAVLDSREKR